MYQYDQYDQKLVDERVEQYRDQTKRFLAGDISEEEFLPLRLQNGLYVQRLAPMLRIAVPYGLMSSNQVRKIAHISRKFDKGYVHFTTRQNIQLNWPLLEEVPDILAELATVEMHAIQTSGNCIRNTTGVKLSVNGRPYIRNLPFYRANSRLPSVAQKKIAPHFCSTILVSSWLKMIRAKQAFISMLVAVWVEPRLLPHRLEYFYPRNIYSPI